MSWSVLVTGSSRGIGLGIVKHFLNHKDPPQIVIASCRNPDSATELQELKKKHKNLHLLQLGLSLILKKNCISVKILFSLVSHIDVAAFDSFPEVVKKVESIVGENGLNVLINNAGIGALHRHIGSLKDMKPEHFQRVYNTNTLGPVFLTQVTL